MFAFLTSFNFWLGVTVGVVVGGVGCAISAKTLGFFNKQVKSVETAVKAKTGI